MCKVRCEPDPNSVPHLLPFPLGSASREWLLPARSALRRQWALSYLVQVLGLHTDRAVSLGHWFIQSLFSFLREPGSQLPCCLLRLSPKLVWWQKSPWELVKHIASPNPVLGDSDSLSLTRSQKRVFLTSAPGSLRFCRFGKCFSGRF